MMAQSPVSPGLTPHGRLVLAPDEDAPLLAPELHDRLAEAFQRGAGHGLLLLGADETATPLPPVFSWWREFGARYVTALCTEHTAAPNNDELDRIVRTAPPMTGGEYLTPAVLLSLWNELDAAFTLELAESKSGVQEFLKRRNPAWNLVGRVHFNLAENRRIPTSPFAFLATYTTRLSAQAKAQHLPLGQALSEYAGAAKQDRLLSLLLPVQRASEDVPVAEDDGRCGRDLSSAALDSRRSAAASARRSAAGDRGRRGAHAGGVAGQSSAAAAGHRHGGRQTAVGTRPGRAARFPHGSHARRRASHRRGNPRPARPIGRACSGARPLGRSRPRTT